MSTRPAPRLLIPTPPGKYDPDFEAQRNNFIQDGVNTKLSAQSTNSGVLLTDTATGQIWNVCVTNGALSVVLVKDLRENR